MTPLAPELTTLEEQVLLLLADGLGMREIACRLGLTERQAIRRRDAARAKLDRPTTTAAVAYLVTLRVAVR